MICKSSPFIPTTHAALANCSLPYHFLSLAVLALAAEVYSVMSGSNKLPQTVVLDKLMIALQCLLVHYLC